jgi:hypothetical protein
MKAARQKTINAVDCFGVGIRADLEELVVVGNFHRELRGEALLSLSRYDSAV